MKITVWEKSLINSVLGASKTSHISELEKIFELRTLTKLTDKEEALLKKDEDKAAKNDTGIELNNESCRIVLKKLLNPNMTVPISRYSMDLLEKLKSEINR